MDIKPSGYRIYAVTMIRNDADIVLPFLAQAEELFDNLLIVDVQSTDGTTEAIASFAATKTKITFVFDRQTGKVSKCNYKSSGPRGFRRRRAIGYSSSTRMSISTSTAGAPSNTT